MFQKVLNSSIPSKRMMIFMLYITDFFTLEFDTSNKSSLIILKYFYLIFWNNLSEWRCESSWWRCERESMTTSGNLSAQIAQFENTMCTATKSLQGGRDKCYVQRIPRVFPWMTYHQHTKWGMQTLCSGTGYESALCNCSCFVGQFFSLGYWGPYCRRCVL